MPGRSSWSPTGPNGSRPWLTAISPTPSIYLTGSTSRSSSATGSATTTPSSAGALRVARQGRAKGLVQLLTYAAQRMADEDQQARCRKTRDYVLRNNRAGIENYLVVPLASSGPMEKAIDILAARRLKNRGMSWRRKGAHNMVRLRTLRLNNRWNDFWNRKRDQQRLSWPAAA
jgi:hypothetical protein